MTSIVLPLVPALLAWGALVFKLQALRGNPGDPALRAYCTTLLALACAFTVLLPPVYLAVDGWVGIPNLARLLGHGFALVAAWAVQVLLLHLNLASATASRAARRLSWGLAGVLLLMSVLFGLAPIDEETTEFMSRYADAPFLMEYWLAFLAYLGLTLVNVVRLGWRYARFTDRATLRVGLRLTALGGVCGLGYVAHEASYLAVRRLGLGYPLSSKELLTQILLATTTGLIVVGSTMPAWGPWVGLPALLDWLARYRAYQRLYPLWSTLRRSNPEIALVARSSRLTDAVAVRHLGLRLYRRVIEIRDGQLALRPFADPRAADMADRLGRQAGLEGEELRAAVEAAALAAALHAKEQGRRPAAAGAALGTPGGGDLEREVAWLERVARWFRSSTLVRAIQAELDGSLEAPADRP